ncbi:MAG: SGNH/GDSL hydrolase family protein [Opitutaceae bacterium]|nr:SGNH/GDSL hydrolase family protein [Verrucomicrobiales bacterium]
MKPTNPFAFGVWLLVLLCPLAWAEPFGGALMYQGRLTDAEHPSNGVYDLRFALFDAAAGGGQAGTSLTNQSVYVTNGLFAVELDFGPGAFDGTRYWLEIGVRTNGDANPYTTLAPRQPVSPAPYAIFAGGVDGSGVVGTISDTKLSTNVVRLDGDRIFSGQVRFLNPSNLFSGAFAGSGSELVGLRTTNLTGTLTTTNPVVRGTIRYGTDIASITDYVTNNIPAAPILGMIRRSLYAPNDVRGQTNWCTILRSPITFFGEYVTSVNPTGYPTSASTDFVFGFEGSSLVVYLRGNGSSMGIEIDGADDLSRVYTPPDGNFHFWTVTFSSWGRRQIRLRLSNYQFGGIYHSPESGLWPAVLPKTHRVIVVGDSISEDTGSTGWTTYLMSLFWNLDVWPSAVGSTGYLNPGTVGRVNFQDRILADVVPNRPDYVVFAGGINDNTITTNSTAADALRDACLNCYRIIQTNLPNCKIIVLGPFWPRTPDTPSIYRVNGAISNACFSAGIISNYVDTLADPWVTGIWHQPGSGNAVHYTSPDGTHPTSAGAWNIAYHVAAELARRFPDLQPREKVR